MVHIDHLPRASWGQVTRQIHTSWSDWEAPMKCNRWQYIRPIRHHFVLWGSIRPDTGCTCRLVGDTHNNIQWLEHFCIRPIRYLERRPRHRLIRRMSLPAILQRENLCFRKTLWKEETQMFGLVEIDVSKTPLEWIVRNTAGQAVPPFTTKNYLNGQRRWWWAKQLTQQTYREVLSHRRKAYIVLLLVL
mgnify:CR=1 FL=1